ncbi:MAG: HlyC/CorC family transporter [Lachnospiraceae bacterium]|nr:HlyC/CorC family transporter [Lachnospiraceae bacterium]
MDAEMTGFILLFVCLLLMDAMFCGFIAMIHSIRGTDIDKNEEKLGAKLTEKMRHIDDNEIAYENRALIAIVATTAVLGAVSIPKLLEWCCDFIVTNYDKMPEVLQVVPQIILSAVFFIIVIFMSFVLMLTFAVLIPRRLVRHLSVQRMAGFATVVMAVSVVLKPLTDLTNLLAKAILRLFGIKKTGNKTDVTEEEIISMVNEGQELGVLEAEEAEMIANIFEYGDKEAKDIMTNRNSITAIDVEMNLPDAIDFMLSEKNSRYPVYEENLDHIVGILHFKDAIRFQNENRRAKAKLSAYPELLREAVFVPETKNIDDLFQEMQSKKLQMVIVSDEYGQTSGLVAMEDILEEIVGNILDEYDEEEEYIEEKGENIYEIDGLTPLEELEEELGITFDDENFETLNGFMISRLEHIPEEDELFEMDYAGYHFKALEIENKIFKTVSVIRNVEETETTDETEEADAIKFVEESDK